MSAGSSAVTTATDFEKLGVFYLGRAYDLATRKPTRRARPLRLEGPGHARRLRRHDRQRQDRPLPRPARRGRDRRHPGDRHRPQGRPRQPAADVPRAAARGLSRRGSTRTTRAARASRPTSSRAQQAELWKKGLADWGQDGERIRRLRDAADFAIYTPGSNAGLPVSILKSFAAPPPAIRDDAELLRERVARHGDEPARPARHRRRSDPEPRAHPALDASSTHAWKRRAGPRPRRADPADPDAAGRSASACSTSSRSSREGPLRAGDALNNLLAAPGFDALAGGRAARHRRAAATRRSGKPRVAIFSIAHLGDAERMFFVSLLLNQVLGWMRAQSGTTSLRAIALHGRDLRLLPAGREPAVASSRC